MKMKDPARPRSGKSRAAKKRPDSREAPSRSIRFLPWALVLLAIFLAALVRIRLLDIPLERDEGEYAYAGQLLLQGIPPYQAAYNMKFPGVYGAYAAIMAVFGQTIAGIHLGFLCLNAGTIVLVFLLGRRLLTPAAGVTAATAYALLSLGSGVYGTQAHATHFVIAAALGATLLLLRAIDNGSPTTVFLSGLLYGVAVLMKQHGVFFAVFGGAFLLVDQWRRRRGAWLAAVRTLGLFLAGSAAPLALTALALWRAGVFGKFWFWTITYARGYVAETSLAQGMANFRMAFRQVTGPNLPLWLLGAAGLVMLWWKKEDRFPAAFLSVLLVFSFFAVCPGWYFRGHYFVVMLPAVALLAGAAVSSTRRIAGWAASGLLYGAVVAISIAQQSDYLLRESPSEAGLYLYGLNPFAEAVPVADYIRTHSEKDTRIAVLGSEPEIYFYANRRSASGYIYTYGMMEPQPFAFKMQNEMIRELEEARPEYVVFVSMPFSWLRRRGSPNKIFDWWSSYGPQNYRVVGVADILSPGHTEYHWDDAATYRPRSERYIAICKRIGK